jgi:lysophospholipase L1-like esterase
MKKNLLLLVFSLIITLLTVELSLRLFWSNPYAGSDADKIVKLRINHVNMNHQLHRKLINEERPTVLYRTNNRGYLEPAIRFDNPDLTIVFLGGSTTECMVVEEQKRFPFLVSKLLEEKGLRVNSLNAARAGNTLHDSLNILLNHVSLENPDIIILMHAINDIGILGTHNDYSSRMGHNTSITDIGKYTVQIASTHSAFIGFIRRTLTDYAHLHWRDDINYKNMQIEDIEPFRARLKIFVATCKAFGIVPIFMTQPITGNIKNEITPEWMDLEAQRVFNRTIREISNITNTEIIDLETYISSNVKNEDELKHIFYDGVHVTDYGSSLYAQHITERIHEILKLQQKE